MNEAFFLDCNHFLSRITGHEYNSSSVKATTLIHQVLKVAHRIFASILFPQEEFNKVGQKELELLWCSAYSLNLCPDFGEWLFTNFFNSTEVTTGSYIMVA